MPGHLSEGRQAPGLIAQQLTDFTSFSSIFQSIVCFHVFTPRAWGQLRAQKWSGFGKGGMDQLHLDWERAEMPDQTLLLVVGWFLRSSEQSWLLHRDQFGCGSIQLISSINHSFSTAELALE